MRMRRNIAIDSVVFFSIRKKLMLFGAGLFFFGLSFWNRIKWCKRFVHSEIDIFRHVFRWWFRFLKPFVAWYRIELVNMCVYTCNFMHACTSSLRPFTVHSSAHLQRFVTISGMSLATFFFVSICHFLFISKCNFSLSLPNSVACSLSFLHYLRSTQFYRFSIFGLRIYQFGHFVFFRTISFVSVRQLVVLRSNRIWQFGISNIFSLLFDWNVYTFDIEIISMDDDDDECVEIEE